MNPASPATEQPDVVVVIVSYKSASLSVDCLQSIARERATSALKLRVVVVDNASGDLPEIDGAIQRHGWGGWAEAVAAPRNGGFAYGNNFGVRLAYDRGWRPRHFHLLNPDTVLLPGALDRLVEFVDSHPKVGIAGGRFRNGDGSDWSIAFRFPSLMGEIESGLGMGPVSRLLDRWVVARTMADRPEPVDWVSGASMLVRREVFDAIGGLDEGFFLYFEETEFCHRARLAGFGVWYVPASLVVHIAGQSTKVTERDVGPRRLPPYWFESRRRYFALTHGAAYARLADLGALLSHAVGNVKQGLQGRRHRIVPRFLGDLGRHMLRPLPAQPVVTHFVPPR